MYIAPHVDRLIASPIVDAHALLPLRTGDRPLLDLSQAAPSFPPPSVVTDALVATADDPASARYAPQPGFADLREALATDLDLDYGAAIDPDRILITAGCNQAFCLVATAVAAPGDNVVLVEPYYFNHDMWLRAQGIGVRHVRTGPSCIPDPEAIRAAATERTRAIVLVTPGNPSGVTIAPELVGDIAAVGRAIGALVIVDETYRTYRDHEEPPHSLFADSDWHDHVASLHSFSKDLAIPGYRVGALVAGEALLAEALKLLDCVAISASSIGQRAALAGLTGAGEWRREQVETVADRQARFERALAGEPGGFELVTSGAYFGWIRHPFNGLPDTAVVERLVLDQDVLVIPGTAFTATDGQMLRFSFANLEPSEIDELALRLAETADLADRPAHERARS